MKPFFAILYIFLFFSDLSGKDNVIKEFYDPDSYYEKVGEELYRGRYYIPVTFLTGLNELADDISIRKWFKKVKKNKSHSQKEQV